MALIISAATGNFNAGATWVGGVVPTVGDEAQAANGHTITITAAATCDLISNTGTGIFVLNDGVTLTANVTNKTTASVRNCLQFTAASPASATLVGNCLGGTANNAVAVANTGSGTLNITGNCTGGTGAEANAVRNVAGGQITITGNCTGGTSSGHAVSNKGSGNITITGNATGGNGSTTAYGIYNETIGTVTLNGIATGGTGTTSSSGAHNVSVGVLNITRAKGNNYGPGNTSNLSAVVGVSNAGLGIIEIKELEYGTYGMSPTSGTGFRLQKTNTNVAVFNYVNSGSAKTLIDATQNAAMPAATDVRSGVSYASGALVGSCAVPSPSSTAFGVPVDNTTGTAILTGGAVATAVWEAASRTITGGLVDTATTLTNAPTVPSAAQIASQVRTELATELARVDVATSSRLAAADYNAPTSAPTAASVANAVWSAAARTITGGTVDTLTNAPTVPSAAAIAAQVWAVADKTGYSLTSAERSAIAAAVEASLLNEGDGQAILNAIVTAIGNSNVDQVALVAAIRSDLERNGGNISAIKAKTDALPASPAATGDIPSANIAAIKAKTDLLNTDRLAQCSTVSTTGAQLAAALS